MLYSPDESAFGYGDREIVYRELVNIGVEFNLDDQVILWVEKDCGGGYAVAVHSNSKDHVSANSYLAPKHPTAGRGRLLGRPVPAVR